MQTLTNLTETISKLTSALTMHEKGKFPAQPESNPKNQQHLQNEKFKKPKYESSQIGYNPSWW